MVYTLIDHNFRPISAREITQLRKRRPDGVVDGFEDVDDNNDR